MEWHELGKFINQINRVRDLLSRVFAALESETSADVQLCESIVAAEDGLATLLADFPAHLLGAQLIARSVDREIWQTLGQTIEEGRLIRAVAEISVFVDLVRWRAVHAAGQKRTSRWWGGPRVSAKAPALFSDPEIEVRSVLTSLALVASLLGRVESLYCNRSLNEDEIFKPRELSFEIVFGEIEAAAAEIVLTDAVGPSEKERLLVYIEDAKLELGSSLPSWRTLTGSLVIAVCLLRAAGETSACQCLETALRHILGRSVDRLLPGFTAAEPAR